MSNQFRRTQLFECTVALNNSTGSKMSVSLDADSRRSHSKLPKQNFALQKKNKSLSLSLTCWGKCDRTHARASHLRARARSFWLFLHIRLFKTIVGNLWWWGWWCAAHPFPKSPEDRFLQHLGIWIGLGTHTTESNIRWLQLRSMCSPHSSNALMSKTKCRKS